MSSFELLIIRLSLRLQIPLDIIEIIKKYYTSIYNISINLYISYNYKSSLHTISKDKMKLFNIISHETYIYKKLNCIGGYQYVDGPTCAINHNQLPIRIQNTCCKYIKNLKLNKYQIMSNKWSMILQIGDKGCELNAYHQSLLSDNSQYGVYKFPLPSFPESLDNVSDSNQSSIPTAITYNPSKQILYGMNPRDYTQKIYSLNFNDDEWKWNINTVNSLIPRYNTSICMVDNDKYIAILGGGLKKNNKSKSDIAELYSINCNKSILIKNMIYHKNGGKSLYHNKLHQIIIGKQFRSSSHDHFGDVNIGIEIYDINKDEWIHIKKKAYITELSNIYISRINPNILFFIGWGRIGWGCPNIYVYQQDLRANIWQKICETKYQTHYQTQEGLDHNFCAIYV